MAFLADSDVSEITNRTTMSSIRGVLIDLSGTLHVEDTVLPGCAAALTNLLSCQDIGVRFVTNTTTKSRRKLIQHLHDIGLENIKAEHVLTSGGIARSVLEQHNLRPLLLVNPSLEEEFDGLDRTNPNAVVVGLAPEHFHYEKLNEAFRVLLNGGSLIALHEARYFAGKDGLNIGPGAFVKALEFSSGTQAFVIGKPAPAFYGQALTDMNVGPAEVVMVGDDVRQDVYGAMVLGMHGVLVQTGKYRSGDEAKIDPPPSYVAEGFPNAVEWILERNSF
ncbi:Haloacid dehalogenase-like hydrolase domain-containing protein 2 [Phytophthora citrophthora]|uniref:Haloacid dehalogenase-like hydrolase domain-containing protein 2 n=1 Tax=Phytophthora citrophthora TaxID=4793 RepID=A0AAD9GZS3_9STRA|nr:Haloacid dehalogenase-like hydrolase domain-containing protein 2 [Phytophthora citrophthora]